MSMAGAGAFSVKVKRERRARKVPRGQGRHPWSTSEQLQSYWIKAFSRMMRDELDIPVEEQPDAPLGEREHPVLTLGLATRRRVYGSGEPVLRRRRSRWRAAVNPGSVFISHSSKLPDFDVAQALTEKPRAASLHPQAALQ